VGDFIRIVVNGMSEEVPKNSTLASLIERFREMEPALIVEHNGRFVYPKEYVTTAVNENDQVEFIHPDFGG
jgi:thiamine biosynthesis protein ThiS